MSYIVNPISVTGHVIGALAKNLAMSIPMLSKIRTQAGRTSSIPTRDKLDRHVFKLFNAVQDYCEGIKGKSVLEIGPGDNIATGLAFLAAGAKSYTALDRFPGPYSSENARRWYKLLADNWPYGEWPAMYDPQRFPDYANVYTKEFAVEGASKMGTYDIICSHYVGEHVVDIHAFVKLTQDCLAKHGKALHIIDFSGHEWDRHGDPFLFLKFPDILWNMMGSARGFPNRVRFGEFKKAFLNAGLIVEVPYTKSFAHNHEDAWVTRRIDESFLTQEAAFLLQNN